VELLQNRPSLLLWIAHDDPPWVAANAALADVHAVRQNYTIDHEIKAMIEGQDPTRTALAASGDLDQHLWLGWREGDWTGYADALPGFVSEFGAQAAPTLGSAAWDELGAHWPVASDDPRWLFSGFQLPAWAEHGAGLPEDHGSLEEFVAAGQEYQAQLLGYAIDQLRKRKFEPCWGALVYQLVDPFPGIGFGLADSARVPRTAMEVVREAVAPRAGGGGGGGGGARARRGIGGGGAPPPRAAGGRGGGGGGAGHDPVGGGQRRSPPQRLRRGALGGLEGAAAGAHQRRPGLA